MSLIGVEPDMKRVPRGWLRSNDEWLAWMPSQENYNGGNSADGSVQKLADGPWLTQRFDREDAYYNSVPPYSEFVQAKVARPVYIVGVRVGFPRGGGVLSAFCPLCPCDAGINISKHSHSIYVAGGVVAVRARAPQGTWVPLYRGTPLHEEAAEQELTKTYWTWSPDVCRLNFKTDEIRIEVDTSIMTGILGNNLIDCECPPFEPGGTDLQLTDAACLLRMLPDVEVDGASSQQAAAIPYAIHANASLLYIPNQDTHGADSFAYSASDCPGDRLRMSEQAKVGITVQSVNDAPVGKSDSVKVEVDMVTNFTLQADDMDPEDVLTFTVLSVPGTATLTTPTGGPVVEGTTFSRSTDQVERHVQLLAKSATCGDDIFSFSVTDGVLTSAATVVSLEVVCPPACSFATDMTFTSDSCDQSSQPRLARWRWRTASIKSDAAYFANNTACDLPRAPALPDDVLIECDFAAVNSSLALGIMVLCATLALAKLGLLAYALIHRTAQVFKQAQMPFVTLTIIGGVMADFAPVFFMGPVTTLRCHFFPSWLLISTTLLYGPLVLKTYRVWKIMDNPKMKRVKSSTMLTLASFCLLLTLEVVVAAIFGVVSPVHAETYTFAFSDYASLSRMRCQDGGSVFTYLAFAAVAILVAAGLYLAFKTRSVTGKYTENKAILGAFYTMTFASVVVIPVTRLFGDSNMLFQFLLVSLAILMVSSVSVFSFMIPKILYHRGVVLVKVHTENTGTTSKSTHSRPAGVSAQEEVDELKNELLEMRQAMHEQRFQHAEKLAELKQAPGENRGEPETKTNGGDGFSGAAL